MTDSLFNRKCLEMLHAGSVKDFYKLLVNFSQDLGFGTVAAMVITDHSPTLTEFQTISNAPAAYLEDFENLELGRIDPVSQHCKRSSVPIIWDRRDYVSQDQQRLYERQAVFGYRSGIAFALHPGRGRHFMFGAEWNHDRCDQVSRYRERFEDLLLFASHAQAAAFELCLPAAKDVEEAPSLTRSELETLRWTMDGKTSWEVGHAMALSERHATLLMRRAMQKLECSTKYESVLKAIRLGLIQCQ